MGGEGELNDVISIMFRLPLAPISYPDTHMKGRSLTRGTHLRHLGELAHQVQARNGEGVVGVGWVVKAAGKAERDQSLPQPSLAGCSTPLVCCRALNVIV